MNRIFTLKRKWQISISWESVDGDFPDNLTDFQYAVQYDIMDDSTSFPIAHLDGQLWSNYDDDDLFMLEVHPLHEGCSGNPWVRYSFQGSTLYQETGDGEAFDTTMDLTTTTMEFEFIGNGFIGVDTRIQRAFGFSSSSNEVWYYEADGDEFDEWRRESFQFGDAELTSYWIVMFVAMALFVLYCCCCCCCIYRSRARGGGRKDTYDTTVTVSV